MRDHSLGFFKRQYAGHIIQAQSDERRRHFKDLIKIKAHQSLQEEGISELELFNRTGNHLADQGAKAAAALHPAPDDELHERVKVQVEFLNSFCILCMKLLGHFPALRSTEKSLTHHSTRLSEKRERSVTFSGSPKVGDVRSVAGSVGIQKFQTIPPRELVLA